MATLVPRVDRANLDVSGGRDRGPSASAAEFGAHQARAMQNVARGLNSVAVVAAQKEDEFNEAEAMRVDAELAGRIRTRLLDVDGGYITTARGAGALDRRTEVETGLQADLDELAGTLSNPRARAMFMDAGSRRLEGAFGQVSTHLARETAVYRDQQSEAIIEQGVNTLAALYATGALDDNAEVQAHFNTIEGEMDELRQRNGWSEEHYRLRSDGVRSTALLTAIQQAASVDPARAQQLYERFSPSLTPDARLDAESIMRRAEDQLTETNLDEAYVYLADGRMPPDDLMRRLPGRHQFQIRETLRNMIARSAAQGAGAFGERSEHLADMLDAMQIDNPRGFMLITDAMRGVLPEDVTVSEFTRLTGMTPQQAVALRPSLAPDDYRRVLERRRGQTDNNAVDTAYSDVMAYAGPIAESMGLVVTGTGQRNAEDRGQFQAFIMGQVRSYVARHGEAPDQDAIQDITRRALLRGRRGDRRREGREVRYGSSYAFQADADTQVTIDYADIPEAEARAIIAQWRARNPGENPSREELMDVVEEIYARQLQGQ